MPWTVKGNSAGITSASPFESLRHDLMHFCHRLDLFGRLIVERDVKLFLQPHDEVDLREGICAQVPSQLGPGRDLIWGDFQFLLQDLLDRGEFRRGQSGCLRFVCQFEICFHVADLTRAKTGCHRNDRG